MQTMIFKKRIFLPAFACLLFFSGPILSQTPQVEEITIVGSFNPTVTDANRLTRNPSIRDTVIAMPPLTYSILSRPLRFSFPVYTIDPLKVKADADPNYLRNYLRLGFGSTMTPYAEFFAGKPQSKRSVFGLHYRHMSSYGKMDGYSDCSFSDHQAEIYGKLIGKVLTWSGEAGFSHNMLHHYGFRLADYNDTVIDPATTRQVYTRITASLGFDNSSTGKSSLNYGSHLRAVRVGDRFETAEINLKYSGHLDYQTDALSTRKSDRIGIKAEGGLYRNTWQAQPSSVSTLLAFRPYFHTEIEEYELYAGLNASMTSDSSSRFYFFPEIRGGLTIVKEILKVYAGITGGIQRNSLENFSRANPFIVSVAPFNFMRNKFEFFGGVNTNLGRYIGFNASVRNASLHNIPFFINDTASAFMHRFVPVYDSGSLIELKGELSFHQRENVHVTLGAVYSSYELESQFKPWHSPELVLFATVRVVAGNKIVLKGNLKYSGESYARVFEKINTGWKENLPLKLDPYADLSLGIEYRFTPRLSAWADFNNITGGSYMRWNQYPVYGFNVMGGITYSF